MGMWDISLAGNLYNHLLTLLCQHEGIALELSLHCQRIAQAAPTGYTAPNQAAMATNP